LPQEELLLVGLLFHHWGLMKTEQVSSLVNWFWALSIPINRNRSGAVKMAPVDDLFGERWKNFRFAAEPSFGKVHRWKTVAKLLTQYCNDLEPSSYLKLVVGLRERPHQSRLSLISSLPTYPTESPVLLLLTKEEVEVVGTVPSLSSSVPRSRTVLLVYPLGEEDRAEASFSWPCLPSWAHPWEARVPSHPSIVTRVRPCSGTPNWVWRRRWRCWKDHPRQGLAGAIQKNMTPGGRTPAEHRLSPFLLEKCPKTIKLFPLSLYRRLQLARSRTQNGNGE